jgi:hypothetical protein
MQSVLMRREDVDIEGPGCGAWPASSPTELGFGRGTKENADHIGPKQKPLFFLLSHSFFFLFNGR